MDALKVAQYTLHRCAFVLRRPISNLQLQKILYYIQGDFLARFNEPLFCDLIVAWKLGPVVEDVYYEYNVHVASPILDTQPVDLDLRPEELAAINQQIDEKSKLSAWDLVEKTHQEDPWKNAFYTKGQGSVISSDEIKNYFKQQICATF